MALACGEADQAGESPIRLRTLPNSARISLGLVLMTLGLHASAASVDDNTLTACADPPEWTFMVRDAAGIVTRSKGSFSVDMLEAAAAHLGRSVRLIVLPWTRCLRQVEAGEIDFALGAYYTEERARRLSYTVPYSRGTPQVYYMRARPVHIESMADLHRYRGCGLMAGTYAHYGLQAKELDLGVNTYDKLITKLKLNRCDYFVEELEVIAGYKLIGQDYLSDPALAHGPVPDVRAPEAHLVAGLNSRGAALIPQLNAEMQELIRTGQDAKLWRRHAGDIPYQTP